MGGLHRFYPRFCLGHYLRFTLIIYTYLMQCISFLMTVEFSKICHLVLMIQGITVFYNLALLLNIKHFYRAMLVKTLLEFRLR